MILQFSARPAQYDHHIVFAQAIPLCNVRHRLGKEVPAYQHIPLPLRQRPHKMSNAPLQFFGLVCGLCIRTAAETFSKLVQNERDLAAAPLFCVSRTETVKGKIAGDLRQEYPKHVRLLRWYRIPGMEPCIVNAFLRILRVVQNAFGYCETVSAVFLCCFRDGVCVLLPIKFYNLTVLQCSAPPSLSVV